MTYKMRNLENWISLPIFTCHKYQSIDASLSVMD